MADPISSTIVGAIAGPVFEQLWKAGGGVAQHIKDQPKKIDAINQLHAASAEYEQRFRDRHGQIKVMPGLMKDPVSLDSIYTAVKLLDDGDIRHFRTEQDLEDVYRQAGRRSFQLGSDKRIDGMAIANQKQYLMVLGGPGIGKSTFLRKLGIEALKQGGQFKRECIPVLIELKTLRQSEVDLFEVIAAEFETCGFPAAAGFAAKALQQGRLLVLLDGLDEVPKRNLNNVTGCIEDFVDRYDKNCFVASCRVAAYDSSFRRFTDVTISEFDDEQIRQFINRWFNSKLDQEDETAEQYWQLLSQPENQGGKGAGADAAAADVPLLGI